MEKKGLMRGLNRKDDTAAQSSVIAPSPSPCMPKPICWAVTDLENVHEMFVNVEKRDPGIMYHVKLQISAIRKNFACENCFSSFLCKALHNSYQNFMLKLKPKQFIVIHIWNIETMAAVYVDPVLDARK